MFLAFAGSRVSRLPNYPAGSLHRDSPAHTLRPAQVAQLVEASVLKTGSCGFDPHSGYLKARYANQAKRLASEVSVCGFDSRPGYGRASQLAMAPRSNRDEPKQPWGFDSLLFRLH